MSQENVERYHRVLDLWNRGDVDGLVGLMDDEVEIFTVVFREIQRKSREFGIPIAED